MSAKFRVGLTRDILDARGQPAFGKAALGILDAAADLEWEYLPKVMPEIDADIASRYDAIYVNAARVPGAAVARPDCRLRVVARHGVGYDSVDVAAMTRAGILVTNTPSSMPRPVATIALTFVLALAGKRFKDRLIRMSVERAHGQHGHRPDRRTLRVTALDASSAAAHGASSISNHRRRPRRQRLNSLILARAGRHALMREADFVFRCLLTARRAILSAPKIRLMH